MTIDSHAAGRQPNAPLGSDGPETVAFVGLAEDAGKTTTLGLVLESEIEAGGTVGLLSTGRDGGRDDPRSGDAEPRLVVPEGQLVAGAGGALDGSGARFDFLERLGWSTPAGPAVLARVRSGGSVALTGLRSRGDVGSAVEAARSHGADRVLVDGAYDRCAVAGAEEVDGLVLSTGAAVAGSVDAIVEATVAAVSRFRLPEPATVEDVQLVDRAVASDRPRVRRADGTTFGLEGGSTLGALGGQLPEQLGEGAALAIPGLVGPQVASTLMDRGSGSALLLVAGPASIQLPDRVWRELSQRWTVRVRRRCRVWAISCNPTAPRGPGVDGRELVAALRDRYPDLQVFDPQYRRRTRSAPRAPRADVALTPDSEPSENE